MVRLKWDNEDSSMYQTGVSQGVFYGDDGVGHAWSGLISVTEKPQTNAPTAIYNAMGQKYDNFGNVAEKKHGLACYTYPEVMDEYLGYEYLEEFGYIVDERPPKKFHMAYRVELGDGLYEIHVLLNQIATFGETARQTTTSIMAPSTITMNLEGAIDPRIGTSHIRLDSRVPFTKTVEGLLFGDQYTEPNIHEFLASEPVWETVAVNYAPIIEPDYDNMVWLGGENIAGYFSNNFQTSASVQVDILDRFTNNGNPVIRTTRVTNGNKYFVVDTEGLTYPKVGDSYTSWVEYELIEDNDLNTPIWSSVKAWLRLYVSGASYEPESEHIEHLGGNKYRYIAKWPPASEDVASLGFRQYLYVLPNLTNAVGAVIDIHDYKAELGSVPTPWTPYLNAPNHKPSEPYTEGYRPGVKNSSEWVSNNGPITVFYDEYRKGLGLYSKTTFESLNTYSDIYWDDLTPYISMNTIPGYILDKRSVYANVKVTIIDPISDLISSRYATIGVGQHGPTADSPPNKRGESVLYILNDSLKTPSGSDYDAIRLYHGGSLGTETVTFTDMLIAPLDQEPTFFDANSNPPSHGIRYQRVSTPHGDYTIKQALLLRTK